MPGRIRRAEVSDARPILAIYEPYVTDSATSFELVPPDLVQMERRIEGGGDAYAGITLPNPASVSLHESFGFVPIGVFQRIGFKFDRWHDVAWLNLRLSEDPRPISVPRSMTAVLREAPVLAMLEACAKPVRLARLP